MLVFKNPEFSKEDRCLQCVAGPEHPGPGGRVPWGVSLPREAGGDSQGTELLPHNLLLPRGMSV